MTTTIGVDLAAQPGGTAVCVLGWGERTADVLVLAKGITDRDILDLIAEHRPAKVAIDSPFGWPTDFVAAVAGFERTGAWPILSSTRTLRLRTTDEAVRAETGRDPLSVSSDKLAICAMRCAGLQVAIAGPRALDRTGGDLAAEVYPAAALRQWGLAPDGYKGPKPENAARRRARVAEIFEATRVWLRASVFRPELDRSDDLLDALVSAVVGRVLELGLTLPIPVRDRPAAALEGWIHLPERRPLASLDPF